MSKNEPVFRIRPSHGEAIQKFLIQKYRNFPILGFGYWSNVTYELDYTTAKATLGQIKRCLAENE